MKTKVKQFIFAILISILFSSAHANQIRYVGFTNDDVMKIESDMNWFLAKVPSESVFYKILRFEMEKGSGISMESIPTFLYNHFPVVMNASQEIKRCPSSEINVCQNQIVKFENWETVQRSEQPLLKKFFTLYTPYLDRKFEETVFGFSPGKMLSVKNRNQNIAVVYPDMLREDNESSDEYRRWFTLSQWFGLARLHQIFSSNGKALTGCKSPNTANVFLCDPYANGSMFIAGMTLLIGSEQCTECSDKERLMLQIHAFDHLVRTGKDESSEKVVQYIKKKLGKILETDNDKIELLMDMYNTRNESSERGLRFEVERGQ